MPKSFDFTLLIRQFRAILITRGILPASDAIAALRLSQASFSRLVRQMDSDLLTLGRARSTRYALRRNIPQVGTRTALYSITESGRPLQLGTLHFIEPRGFVLEPKQSGISEASYSDLPYFLDDMRPSGFLGRLIPRSHPELGAPLDILNWSVDDCLRYWTLKGWNPIGNLIVGESAVQKFLEYHHEASANEPRPLSPKKYPEHARSILEQGEAGSSAGGEQPKFALEATSKEAASLVKFSPPMGDPIGRRVADLLICESICHGLLSSRGYPAAKSKIIEAGNQIFLQIERFDRAGQFGRRGLISLRALSMEFAGTLDSWSRISESLQRAGIIRPEAHSLIRELETFGELIGNTDMHAGNFSFYLDDKLRLGDAAPVYDMLPMMYYPRQNQLLDRAYEPRPPLPEDSEIWKKTAEIALEFWTQSSKDSRISADFRKTAAKNKDTLRKRIQWASDLF